MSKPVHGFIKDSGLLVIDSIIAAGLTGGFWLIAARVAAAREVGIASTIISAASLIALLSRLGADYAIPYYVPKITPASRVIRTAFACTVPLSLVLGLITALSSSHWLPGYTWLSTWTGATAFTILTISLLAINLFLAIGITTSRVAWVIAQDTIQNGGRLLVWALLLALTAIGAKAEGLVLASIVSAVGSVILGIITLLPHDTRQWFHHEAYLTMRSYALRSHGTSLLATAPGFVLPIISTSTIGPEQTAVLAVCWMLLNLFTILHSTFASISFAHGSRDSQSLNTLFPRLMWLTWAGLAVLLLIMAVAGQWILGFFGPIYATSGASLLTLFTGSLFFMAASDYAIVRHRTTGTLKPVYAIMLFRSLGTIVLSIILAPHYGVIGFGYAQLFITGVAFLAGLLFDPLQPFRKARVDAQTLRSA